MKGRDEPVSTRFDLYERRENFPRMIYLLENMFQTGKPQCPVERTLLTTGILDAVMTSRHDKSRRIDTKHLDIRYQPTDWPFATDPVPKAIKR